MNHATLDLPLARYRIECEAETWVHLPAFAGSTLRGIFGHALRKAACLTSVDDCKHCPLSRSCAYARVFEPCTTASGSRQKAGEQAPRPYIIEPAAWGEKNYAPGEGFTFQLVLAGQALDHLPLLLWALSRGLSKGLGRGMGQARLQRVVHLGETETIVLASPDSRLADHDNHIAALSMTQAAAVTLHFDTPLRLQNNGRRASADEYTPRRLLCALMRRISDMASFHGSGPLLHDFPALAALADNLDSAKQLQWRDWSRYSQRQQSKMDLGGVVGSWTLAGDLTPFLPFLHLGQWLHVGKEATFGLGGYHLEIKS